MDPINYRYAVGGSRNTSVRCWSLILVGFFCCHGCQLLLACRSLVLVLPLGIRHSVNQFSGLFIVDGLSFLRRGLGVPFGQTVATEVRQNHKIYVLHILMVLQMVDQPPKYGGFNVSFLAQRNLPIRAWTGYFRPSCFLRRWYQSPASAQRRHRRSWHSAWSVCPCRNLKHPALNLPLR